MKALLFSLPCLALFLGCPTTSVILTLKNDQTFSQAAKIEAKDEDGITKKEISLGDITANSQKQTKFDVDDGGTFVVSSSLVNSGVVFKSAPITVIGDPDPFETSLSLIPQCNILDDTQSLTVLSQSFKNVGSDLGAQPLQIQNAIDTRIGAIVVAELSEANKPSKIIFAVPPGQLGVKVLSLGDIVYPGTNEMQEVSITGKTTAAASANIGMLSHFGLAFEESNLYHLKWIMRGFGQVVKSEDPAKNYVTKFNALDKAVIDQIKGHLSTNDKAKLFYINSFYVLERAELFIKKAKSVNAGADFNAANIISGNSAFTFDQVAETNQGYGAVVLNYWGDELKLSTVDADVAANTAEYNTSPDISSFLKQKKGEKVEMLMPTGNKVLLSTEKAGK